MTKAELIEFLEPFTDEARILVGPIVRLRDPEPHYQVLLASYPLGGVVRDDHQIDYGEGFVVL